VKHIVALLTVASLAAFAPQVARADEEEFQLARVPSDDESIYVTQKRAYSKKGHVEFTPIFGAVLNTRFVSTMGLYGALTYHVKENFAIEAIGGYSGVPFSRFTEATIEIREKESLEAPAVDRKWMDWFVGLDAQWSPFYGKLRLIPGVLGVFDVYVLAGFGIVGTRAPCTPNATYNGQGDVDQGGTGVQGITGTCAPPERADVAALPAGIRFAGQFGGGVRLFFANWFGVRLEIRDIIYSESVTEISRTAAGTSEMVSTDIRNNVLFIVGLSFLF
jgi:outer membrane beta-barrel protein